MSKNPAEQGRTAGPQPWRAVRIAAITVLGVSALTWFFTDPLHVPEDVLEALDQRASVIGMFTGAAGLVIATLGLRAQLQNRPADTVHSPTVTPAPRRRTTMLLATVPAAAALIVLAVVWVALPGGPPRYEAEAGVPHKAVPLNGVDGASNRASMGYLNEPDSWVDIRVQAPQAGTYTAHVRYRAGDGHARHFVTVNGQDRQILEYPALGWGTWATASLPVKLNQGWNTLRFQHHARFAELDYIEIT
ncbi:hypothetical protein [Nonomuraea ceibae]|uniref:hypothetical protein n=1 Tax=Nonomuraea ceibae TaxID=1935170 RepID=UPI001C5E86C1|nr:hypothetical protein [Nonomuraea ceibae]